MGTRAGGTQESEENLVAGALGAGDEEYWLRKQQWLSHSSSEEEEEEEESDGTPRGGIPHQRH
jgi:hypothetical protein